ncbi:Regulator of protease activity HflC, stomatin/prohibitin superfamily [Fodinibius salinus]|uniref:Regulator of protease activity HflC, stomatin/prohibitin superfamily n=1 Tax=Fodinibius salinus TaxID=860790 RepID=A0A5D3YIJ2_9BACT|nr:slipin family protein [Fodinibius salinus]TYP93664.1 Regulator of protease activity HflC, stomatin/prohibitin superfamily [Fodinibius salinus]
MESDSSFYDILVWIVTIAVLAAILLPQMFKILREYERAVVFRLGKYLKTKGPGLIFLIPFIDKIERVDLRVLTINVDRQEVITKDNVTVHVDAITFFRVMDAEQAVIQVEKYIHATSMLAQTTLRSIVGQVELDELLAEREKVNKNIQEIIDRQTDPWGIKVVSVEVRDVVLPENMKRAMARQAETERDRRAKVINAQGEYQAAERMVDAAQMMEKAPMALQLRFLQTMAEVSEENATFAMLPLPMEMLDVFKGMSDTNLPSSSNGDETDTGDES